MNYLKQKLIEKHITQSELARRTGVTEATISRYLNKKRKMNLQIIYQIAIVLDISLEELVKEMLEQRK